MNKRIQKKKILQKHRKYCHPEKISTYQCPKCGWDSAEADPDLEMGRILWQCGGLYDLEFCVEYICPVCRTVFSYEDGV